MIKVKKCICGELAFTHIRKQSTVKGYHFRYTIQCRNYMCKNYLKGAINLKNKEEAIKHWNSLQEE